MQFLLQQNCIKFETCSRPLRHRLQAKMALICEELCGECFDSDCLSASCLGGLVLKRGQKEAVSRSLEAFSSCGSSSTPRCNFKRSFGEFCQLQPFQGS